MHNRSKGAILMLAIVVLWATLPGLACLAPAMHDSCCQQMMQDCGSSMVMANPSCCKVHSSDTSVPPAQANTADGAKLITLSHSSIRIDASSLAVEAMVRAAENPPSSTYSSILRI
jgi:hypothetical protein